MRRLLHLLIMSSMITGLLFFGATSAFAQVEDLELPVQVPDLGGGDDPTGGLLGEGGVQELLCSLIGEEGLIQLIQCKQAGGAPVPPPSGDVPPAAIGGDIGGGHIDSGQVSSVPSGGVSTGGGTAPVGATALMGTLLAVAAVGAGLGRALARS